MDSSAAVTVAPAAWDDPDGTAELTRIHVLPWAVGAGLVLQALAERLRTRVAMFCTR